MNTVLLFLGVSLASALFLASLLNWRFGVYGLLVYLPVAGFFTLRSGSSALALLAKDILFVIPAYVSFFMTNRRSFSNAPLPTVFVAALVSLAALVAFQAANPNIPNILVAVIGAKVWLFYIPLAFMAAAAINTEEDLIRLLRILAVVALIPLTIGFAQQVGVQLLGPHSTQALFYGEEFADHRYHLFASFAAYGINAENLLYRINSTFSAVGQYYTYILTTIPLAFALSRIDHARAWRFFARAMVVASVVAAFLSGARGAVFFVPIVFAPILLLGKRPVTLLLWAIFIPAAYVISLALIGIDFNVLLDETLGRAVGYSQEYAWDYIGYALNEYPFGLGSGMNTNGARYAFSATGDAAAASALIGIESFYVKSIVELSLIGIIPVVIILFAPLIRAVSLSRFSRSSTVRQCAAALAGFFLMVAIYSIRNWPLDIDPVNVDFWIFVGLLYKLPSIARAASVGTETVPQMMQPFPKAAMPAE